MEEVTESLVKPSPMTYAMMVLGVVLMPVGAGIFHWGLGLAVCGYELYQVAAYTINEYEIAKANAQRNADIEEIVRTLNEEDAA